MVGSTLKHYEIVRLLGKGGMGEVYLATDTRLDRVLSTYSADRSSYATQTLRNAMETLDKKPGQRVKKA